MTRGNLYFFKNYMEGNITKQEYGKALGMMLRSCIGKKRDKELEEDILWAVNSVEDGDSGETILASHEAALYFIARMFMEGRISLGPNTRKNHKWRYSDSSFYDAVCVNCNINDRHKLANEECPNYKAD